MRLMGVSIGSFQAVTLAMEGGGVYSHCLSDEGGVCIAAAAATEGLDHG